MKIVKSTKIPLLIGLLIIGLVTLNVLNSRVSFPPSICLGCDKSSFNSTFGWPVTFTTTSFDCKGGDPNLGEHTRIGCEYTLVRSYRYDGLAINVLMGILIVMGFKIYVGRIKGSV